MAVAASAIYRWQHTPPAPADARRSAEPHAAIDSFTPAPTPSTSSAGMPEPINGTEPQRLAAEADPPLVAVKGMLRDYRARFGENPVGTNKEITQTLTGKNPDGALFISDEASIENRLLVDRWHHPYFFHQLSRSEMEVRSAGPDGVLWTSDDEVLH